MNVLVLALFAPAVALQTPDTTQPPPNPDRYTIDVAAIVQSPFEHAHGFHAGESAAEHHDAHHRVTSTPRSPATTSPITIAVSPAAVSTCRARPASAARTMTT